jgi:hypothetical protein
MFEKKNKTKILTDSDRKVFAKIKMAATVWVSLHL